MNSKHLIYAIFILIAAIIVNLFTVVYMQHKASQLTREHELLQIENEALFKIKTDLEAELIKLNKKEVINEIHNQARMDIINSNFFDKLEHINRADVEALRVFDRYNQ